MDSWIRSFFSSFLLLCTLRNTNFSSSDANLEKRQGFHVICALGALGISESWRSMTH